MVSMESDHKTKMVATIKKRGGWARRIEDQYGVGILDMIVCTPHTGMFVVEAKRFTNKFFEPSPRQYVEALNVMNAGGVAALVGFKGNKMYVANGNLANHTSKSVKGRVYEEDCVVQRDDEDVYDTLIRWYKETVQ